MAELRRVYVCGRAEEFLDEAGETRLLDGVVRLFDFVVEADERAGELREDSFFL